MLGALGITAPVGKAFRCILPGHEESRPSASIYQDSASGVFMYRDWHRRDGLEWFSLAWVRAALAYGEVKQLRAPETARWYLRLFHEARLVTPVDVELPPLPPSARGTAEKVAAGFRLLLGLRRLVGDEDPIAFTRRFASAWCDVGERQAGDAISELRDCGVIARVDECRYGGKSIPLYLPGKGSPGRRVRR